MTEKRGRDMETKKRIISDYLARYPLRYAAPVLIGVLTQSDQTMKDSATATLLQIGDCKLLVTNEHVVERYEELKRQDRRISFQIGAAPFDPLARQIDRNSSKDLFVMAADNLELPDERSTNDNDIPALEFYKAQDDQWPAPIPREGDTVIFGGFPGRLRKQQGFTVANTSHSIAAVPITGVFDRHFSCNMDRSTWETTTGADADRISFKEWGGMSGSPVLMDGPGLLRPTLVGFISQYKQDIDQLIVTHAAHIATDGSIITGNVW